MTVRLSSLGRSESNFIHERFKLHFVIPFLVEVFFRKSYYVYLCCVYQVQYIKS